MPSCWIRPFNHYEMPLLNAANSLCSEIYFAVIIATLFSVDACLHGMLPSSFYF